MALNVPEILISGGFAGGIGVGVLLAERTGVTGPGNVVLPSVGAVVSGVAVAFMSGRNMDPVATAPVRGVFNGWTTVLGWNLSRQLIHPTSA